MSFVDWIGKHFLQLMSYLRKTQALMRKTQALMHPCSDKIIKFKCLV